MKMSWEIIIGIIVVVILTIIAILVLGADLVFNSSSTNIFRDGVMVRFRSVATGNYLYPQTPSAVESSIAATGTTSGSATDNTVWKLLANRDTSGNILYDGKFQVQHVLTGKLMAGVTPGYLAIVSQGFSPFYFQSFGGQAYAIVIPAPGNGGIALYATVEQVGGTYVMMLQAGGIANQNINSALTVEQVI